MNSNDLFSFLDDAAPSEEPEATNGHAEPMDVDTDKATQEPSLKRKADAVDGSRSPHTNGNGSIPANQDGGPSPKKPRMSSPKPLVPVVLDSVEIEAKREVAASAGLTGGVEAGSRLELKHQVRTSPKFRPLSPWRTTDTDTGSTSSRCSSRLPICTHRQPCATRKAGARVQVRTRSVPTGLCARDSTERECPGVGTH